MTDLFFQLAKADFKGEFEGCMTSTALDSDGERPAFAPTVKAVQDWSTSQAQATGNRNFGNIREQHDESRAIGFLTEPPRIDYPARKIWVKGKVVDPVAREKLQEGVFSGLSLGGAYADRQKKADGSTEFVPRVAELSLVDKPSCPDALLTVVRADGSTLQKRFRRYEIADVPRDHWGFPLQQAVYRDSLYGPVRVPTQHEYLAMVKAGVFRKPYQCSLEKSRENPNVRQANAPFMVASESDSRLSTGRARDAGK
jgi:hypothetical protein